MLCNIVYVIVKCKLKSCYDKKIQGQAYEKKLISKLIPQF